MSFRDELKVLIDRLPESSLEAAKAMLERFVRVPMWMPASMRPEVQRMRERGQEYRKQVEQRFQETRKPGTIGGMGGSGSEGTHEGTPFARHGFSYWDERALVQQTLQSFDGHDIEIMQRFSISPDRTKLICKQELSSGGHIVEHEDGFPISS